MKNTTYQIGKHETKTKTPAGFESLNVCALYEVLADILGDKYGAKITYTVKVKEAQTA